MVEREMISSSTPSPERGSSRWKQVLKWGAIGAGIALVIAVLV